MSLNPNAVELLLLDAGNTIVYLDHDAVGDLVGLTASAVQRAERPAKRHYAKLLRAGMSHADGWRIFIKSLLREAGAHGDLDEQVDVLRAAHERLNLWRRVPDDLPAHLERARLAGLRLGVISNSEGGVRDILNHVGVAHHFDLIVDSHEVGVCKPDPKIFEIALNHFGVNAHRALYAGDIVEVDVDGARNAGLQAALIDTLGHYETYDAAPRFEKTCQLIAVLLSKTNPAT